ncbi:RNA pol II accessory factor, Cdc73 family-domain-containing protein [Piptocephalis cylindrospora]|uniref:RNA pol II accessory factor, Cdc73 family-domain-containing protein n=1 Tax=Piptocephalis cylindrospora TaxID=1907219 RepID=A0A4P9Y1D6_9FUNG|nr:RNA pol II accessory factor, Cdc73 family-domain-containing protein [Piptocephalis cylindrospora]|eukprot:RKP11610.1 RNA pol II accessory factor, Cdc73 family-domain-containing protein [Piptocephalis cylindrospora]
MPHSPDPLTLLRQHITEGVSLRYLGPDGQSEVAPEQAAFLAIGHYTFPAKTPLPSLTRGGQTGAEAYPLDAITFFWTHRDQAQAAFREYALQCFKANMASVQVMDFRRILSLLQEKPVGTGPTVDGTAVSGTGIAHSRPSAGERMGVDSMEVMAKGSTQPDTAASMADSSASHVITSASSTSTAMLTDIALISAVTSRFFPVRSRESYLGCNKSFGHIRKRAMEALRMQRDRVRQEVKQREKLKTNGKAPAKPSSSSSSSTHSSRSPSSSRANTTSQSDPIILVPAAATSLINIYNVKEFLQGDDDSSPPRPPMFVDANKMREESKEKPTQVTVTHVSGDGKTHRFRVIDRADHLTSREWNNVVAALVTGQAWQFKMWKWKEPAELFHNLK